MGGGLRASRVGAMPPDVGALGGLFNCLDGGRDGLLSLAFAAWRAGVAKPAVASLSFWSATVLARTVGALSLGVLSAGCGGDDLVDGERAGAEVASKVLDGRDVGGDDLARCYCQVGERRLLRIWQSWRVCPDTLRVVTSRGRARMWSAVRASKALSVLPR